MLDLETTGGDAVHDHITEIAAVRVEGGIETARWSTLVNPGMRIPPFIESLTGITDAMVADAPPFAEAVQPLLAILGDAVLVVHNVRFDHGFLHHEMARLDIPLKVQTLCIVRLSRKLYPQHKGHGLDAIMQRHGLRTVARHRAMGDVDVVLQWLKPMWPKKSWGYRLFNAPQNNCCKAVPASRRSSKRISVTSPIRLACTSSTVKAPCPCTSARV